MEWIHEWFIFAIWRTLESAIREDGKKVNVLYIADRHYQRSVIVIDHSRNFKGIYSMVVTMEKYLYRKRKLLFKIEKRKYKKAKNLPKITTDIRWTRALSTISITKAVQFCGWGSMCSPGKCPLQHLYYLTSENKCK